jgi:hypothetical protein
MTDEMKQIAYNEGVKAYVDDVLCIDCPYYGVSEVLAEMWEEGWWDMFYDRICYGDA